MPTRTLTECSVCKREMGRVVEVRIIVHSPTWEECRRYDICSPACGLTAARQLIEGAWESGGERCDNS